MRRIILSVLLISCALLICVRIAGNVNIENQNEYIDIGADIMLGKIENQETFTVYFYQEDCNGCMEVNDVLNTYIKSTGDQIYAIDLNNTDYPQYLVNILKIQSSPTIIRFEKGQEQSRLSSVFNLEELKKCISGK